MSIAQELQIIKLKAGERIVQQGDQSDKAYMILSGKMRVFLESDEKIVELAELGEDEIFGESAIFTDLTYGANVEAVEDSQLYIITKDALNSMLQSTDPIIRALIQMLIARLKVTNEALLKSETREFIDVALI